MKVKHVGISANRLHPKADNPREVVFARLWQEQNDLQHTLEYILSNDNRRAVVSERDIEVAATVIQWLGSNVGMSFLTSAIEASPQIRQWMEWNSTRKDE